MRIHKVSVERQTYGKDANGSGDFFSYKSPVRVLISGHSNIAGIGVGGWGRSDRNRVVTGGPLINGPVAFAYNLSVCIADSGGTTSDIERERKDGLLIEAEPGDVLEMFGERFVIGFEPGRRNEFVTLTPAC